MDDAFCFVNWEASFLFHAQPICNRIAPSSPCPETRADAFSTRGLCGLVWRHLNQLFHPFRLNLKVGKSSLTRPHSHLPPTAFRLPFLTTPHPSRGPGQQKTCFPSRSQSCATSFVSSKSFFVDRVWSAPNQKASTTVKSSIHLPITFPSIQVDHCLAFTNLILLITCSTRPLSTQQDLKHCKLFLQSNIQAPFLVSNLFFFMRALLTSPPPLSPRLLSFPLLCLGIFKANLSAAILSKALVHNPPSSAVLPGFLTPMTELSLLPPPTVLPSPKYLRPIRAKLSVVIFFARLFSTFLV